MGVSHAGAALFHQMTLLLTPAFALGLLLIPGGLGARIGRVMRYGAALAGIGGTAYLIAGVVVAGQRTPEGFLAWVNTATHVGTWGVWRADILAAATSG